MTWFRGFIGLGILMGALQSLQLYTRPYHHATVAQLAGGTFLYTHAELTGRVLWSRREADGDLHIKLVDSSATADTAIFIVAECIPLLPCQRPSARSVITVRGITRRDPEHKFYEIHPVEWLSP